MNVVVTAAAVAVTAEAFFRALGLVYVNIFLCINSYVFFITIRFKLYKQVVFTLIF